MRHFHISPSESICADELNVMEAQIREVYQIDPALPVLIAEHQNTHQMAQPALRTIIFCFPKRNLEHDV